MESDMAITKRTEGYQFGNASASCSHAYLLPTVRRELAILKAQLGGKRRLFDLGCGNGSVGAVLYRDGWEVVGVDPSSDGITHAHSAYPELKLQLGSAYDDLATIYGRFPVVMSLEVVEHVYAPRHYAQTLFDLVEPGGYAIISTPYHGYLKNLALAVTGKMDRHFTALWDHGHIKFWSIATLSQLLLEAGFRDIRVQRVGRIPALAKSMLMVVRKP